MSSAMPEPALLVIFGVSGDLAQRKLLPAIYHLIKDNLLHEKTMIVGLSRRSMSTDDLLKNVELCVLESDSVCDPVALKAFKERFSMLQLDPAKGSDYDELLIKLNQLEDQQALCLNRLFYLAVPPALYAPIVRNLGQHKLNASCQHNVADSRVLIEKPFGYDLASAHELISEMQPWFKEEQIFRIDHYLAKETTQNLLAFRQENYVFQALWSAQHISRLEIVASEQIGVEGRAEFYEQTGALRDFVQNHLLQLLAIITMEPPKASTSDAVHAAKQTLLAAVRPPGEQAIAGDVVRAQYQGYREEIGNPRSTTETFVSLPLSIETNRWRGAPIRLTTGKALSAKRTDITVSFKPVGEAPANQLIFRIQPNEGIGLHLCVKKPGYEQELQVASMDFSYRTTFDDHGHPDAYERVLVDAVRGDQTLFSTSQEVLRSWEIIQPILDAWARGEGQLASYPQGTSLEIVAKNSAV